MLLATGLHTLSKIVRFGYTFYTFLQNIKLSDFEDSNRKKTISEFVCTKTVLRSYYSYYILFFGIDVRKYSLTVQRHIPISGLSVYSSRGLEYIRWCNCQLLTAVLTPTALFMLTIFKNQDTIQWETVNYLSYTIKYCNMCFVLGKKQHHFY